MRATTSASGLAIACQALRDVRRTPASSGSRRRPPARPARSICGRSAASRIGGGWAGGCSSLNRLIVNVSNSPSTRSPASAARTNRSTSRVRWYGRSKAMPFQLPTITGLDAPRPRTNRPGAASASAAADMAISAGPRVKTGTIAVPSRSVGCPGRGERERGEGVGAGRLGRPGVGVAEGRQRAGRGRRAPAAARRSAGSSVPSAHRARRRRSSTLQRGQGRVKQPRHRRAEVLESGTDGPALQVPMVDALGHDRQLEIAEADVPRQCAQVAP